MLEFLLEGSRRRPMNEEASSLITEGAIRPGWQYVQLAATTCLPTQLLRQMSCHMPISATTWLVTLPDNVDAHNSQLDY